MNKRFLWISVLAVVVSFIGGFLLANALNRNELHLLRAENERLKKTSQDSPNNTLADEEIRAKIAEADQNPESFEFQKNLGIALYRYARIKQDVPLLTDVERLLSRANKLNEKDFDVLETLGHTYFDIGYAKKDNENFQKSREIYEKALAEKPGNIDIKTDYGLTYLFENPPQNEKAVEQLNKVLEENPRHERALQFIAQAHVRQKNYKEAENYLAKLKEVNPKNEFIAELESQIK
ncbi:MAG TPA: tetratricopeptide repeat protein [Pyrinomonadaceae bacterium]|nr:tetratricopeptide repeat protein [Pyrinomonadaceae bacterium]